MGRSNGLFFGRSSASLEDDDNDSAEKAFAWDSLSMSKKKRCLYRSTSIACKLQSWHQPLNKWMTWYESKRAYHLESDVNSGWKAVARTFPCRTATITRSLEYTSSCHVIAGQLAEISRPNSEHGMKYCKNDNTSMSSIFTKGNVHRNWKGATRWAHQMQTCKQINKTTSNKVHLVNALADQ